MCTRAKHSHRQPADYHNAYNDLQYESAAQPGAGDRQRPLKNTLLLLARLLYPQKKVVPIIDQRANKPQIFPGQTLHTQFVFYKILLNFHTHAAPNMIAPNRNSCADFPDLFQLLW